MKRTITYIALTACISLSSVLLLLSTSLYGVDRYCDVELAKEITQLKKDKIVLGYEEYRLVNEQLSKEELIEEINQREKYYQLGGVVSPDLMDRCKGYENNILQESIDKLNGQINEIVERVKQYGV